MSTNSARTQRTATGFEIRGFGAIRFVIVVGATPARRAISRRLRPATSRWRTRRRARSYRVSPAFDEARTVVGAESEQPGIADVDELDVGHQRFELAHLRGELGGRFL